MRSLLYHILAIGLTCIEGVLSAIVLFLARSETAQTVFCKLQYPATIYQTVRRFQPTMMVEITIVDEGQTLE